MQEIARDRATVSAASASSATIFKTIYSAATGAAATAHSPQKQ